MKFIHLISPAIALILVGTWIVPQRRSMAAIETECARLRSTLTAAEAPSRTRPDPLEKRRKIIEWTKLGTQFQSNPMSVGQLPSSAHFLTRERRCASVSGWTR